MMDDFADRIDLHAQVTLPDWIDSKPPLTELEGVMAWHIWVLAAAENCIRQIEQAISEIR